jgi:hypothetical protein
MEPEGLLPCSQEPSTPDRSSPYHLILSLTSILILSTHLRLGLPSGFFPSAFLTNSLYIFVVLIKIRNFRIGSEWEQIRDCSVKTKKKQNMRNDRRHADLLKRWKGFVSEAFLSLQTDIFGPLKEHKGMHPGKQLDSFQ